MGSDTLRGLVGRKRLEWYFPAVGQARFLASQEGDWSFWFGYHVSETWEYREHLNGGTACCRLCGQLYLGESLGFLVINLLVRVETTAFVGRLAPPVIPATGTQLVDQG